MSSLFDASYAQAQSVLETAKSEHAARKTRKKLLKTQCGRCGRGATGTRLQTCSRCKGVNYCSAVCQREHWKAGHKADCNGFTHPPFAKQFDRAEHDDVPWPVDPIFASVVQDGVGMWVTTHGSLDCLLQQAFVPVDQRAIRGADGPPSYKRWAGIAGPNPDFGPERLKFIGSTLLGLRVVVQNRRQDGQVVAIFPGQMDLVVLAHLQDNLLPEDRKKATQSILPDDGTQVMSVTPWIDYTGLLRAGILEINGVEAPTAKFLGSREESGEFEPVPKPNGGPWDRVVDWSSGSVMLGQGDYVVFACQYRIGDGVKCKTYPHVLAETVGVSLPMCRTEHKSGDKGWCERARSDVARAGGTDQLTAPIDQAYFAEYYGSYFDEGPDAFAAARLGSRATQLSEMDRTVMPAMFGMLMQSMSPEGRAEFLRRSSAMGIDLNGFLNQTSL
ncbi:hypothetical protein AURDEDRAFT_186345 [Auricularia subglabra TFB-10046 SS5]|nr:hypothetical protein AURDEDRAFT_186345 [Auricularia subglabra TFB-10046 SS5]